MSRPRRTHGTMERTIARPALLDHAEQGRRRFSAAAWPHATAPARREPGRSHGAMPLGGSLPPWTAAGRGGGHPAAVTAMRIGLSIP